MITADDNRARAFELIKNAPDVWDMTLPCIEDYWDMDTVRRFKDVGFSFVSATIEDFPATFDGVSGYIERLHTLAQQAQDWLSVVTTIEQIDDAKRAGKLALGINVQDAAPIETDISRVRRLRELGVRQMLLAYNIRNYIADGCAESSDAGLSNFGRAVVKEMNAVGIIVDGSHTGRRSTLEAIDLSRHPVIFSHSGVHALSAHIRNLKDDQIRACAARGGVIGIVGNGSCLGDADAAPATMFRHLNYVVEMVGPEHVGLGLDYLKNKPAKRNPDASNRIRERMAAKRTAWPNQSIVWPNPSGTQIPLEDSSTLPPEQLVDLVALMVSHGYPESAINGILGGNFRRAYGEVK